jgi:hypothetical protein
VELVSDRFCLLVIYFASDCVTSGGVNIIALTYMRSAKACRGS